MESQVIDDSHTIDKYYNFINSYSEPTTPLLNGFVVHYIKNIPNKRLNFKCKKFAVEHYFMKTSQCKGLPFEMFVKAVSDVFKQIKRLRTKKSVGWSKIVQLFNTPFAYQPPSTSKRTSFEALHNKDLVLEGDVDLNLVGANDGIHFKPLEVTSPSVSQDVLLEATSTSKESNLDLDVEGKLKNSTESRKEKCPMCDRRNKKILKRQEWIKFVTNKYDPFHLPSIKILQQCIRRHNVKIEALKPKVKAQFEKEQERHQLEIEPLSKELNYLQDSYTEMQVKFQNDSAQHQQKLLEVKSELSCYQTEIDMLKLELARVKAENKLLLKEKARVIEQYEVVVLEGGTESESD